MPFIDPNADIREAQAVAAIPLGRPGVVIDGRLHPYASMGSRISATLIDLLAYWTGLLGVLIFCAYLITITSLSGSGDGGISIPALTICVVYIVVSFGPLTFRGHGQSLGKRMIGIRVVRGDSSSASLATLMLRETPWRAIPLILLPIQMTLTPFHLVLAGTGLLFALLGTANARSQTFYDRLADTVVVHEDPVRLAGAPVPDAAPS